MNVPLKRYWELLVRYLLPMWPKVLLMTVIVLVSAGLQIISPQIMRFFIDTAIVSSYFMQLSFMLVILILTAVVFLGVSLLMQLVGIAANYVGVNIAWQTMNQLRVDVARHCLRLDMSFHNEHTPGEMIARIDGDVGSIGSFFSQFTFTVLSNVLLVIGVLIMLAYEDWHISVALIVYIAIALAGVACLRKVAVPYWRASRQADAELFGFLEEQLSSREDIRASGAETYVIRSLFWLSRARLGKQLRSAGIDSLLSMVWTVLYTMGQIVALVSAYSLFRQGEITIGTVFLIINYAHLILQPVMSIAGQVQSVQQAAAGISRIDELYAMQSKIRETDSPRVLPAGPLGVVFDNVTFGYNETEPVLRDVTFSLQPGQVLGLLGRTGSGKTTLTRLLFRLYDPTQGIISLGANGVHSGIREVRLDNLRQCIGMVTQNVQLFQATVRDNLTFFDRSVQDTRILQVIEELGLSDWYASLPEGLDTELETAGGNLSAGEAQLLAFARVFLKEPSLVILDEASSRLDPATEQLIERAVDKLFRDRTGIIIAHRLGTVHRADQIMVMEGGRIQECGAYSVLVHDPTSRFYNLLRTGMEEVLI
jgi:ATP-binding cassette subfamily B protein